MTEDELVELEMLCNKATPVPWIWGLWDSDPLNMCGGNNGEEVITMNVWGRPPCLEISKEDMAFIAAAREWLPKLVAEVRRLQDEKTNDYWCQLHGVQNG